MTENPPNEIDKLVSSFLGKAQSPELVEHLRSAKREEVLTRLASLLDASFKKGSQPHMKAQVQQRWFTICGYIAQVMARLVRDLEYEKLRADIDDLKKRVAARDVHTPRRSWVSPRRELPKATDP